LIACYIYIIVIVFSLNNFSTFYRISASAKAEREGENLDAMATALDGQENGGINSLWVCAMVGVR